MKRKGRRETCPKNKCLKLGRRLPRYIPQSWRRNSSRIPQVSPDPLIPFQRSHISRPKIGTPESGGPKHALSVTQTSTVGDRPHPAWRRHDDSTTFNRTRTETQNELDCIYTCLAKTNMASLAIVSQVPSDLLLGLRILLWRLQRFAVLIAADLSWDLWHVGSQLIHATTHGPRFVV